MLEEKEIRKVAQKVVDMSKRSARVDTGALRRSISYTYVNKIVIFRELFYGQFGTNSLLERNAARLMPNGTEYKIIYTTFGGQTVEISPTKKGRASQISILKTLTSGTTNKIKALIARNKLKRNGTATE
jgi:hypothetical protein